MSHRSFELTECDNGGWMLMTRVIADRYHAQSDGPVMTAHASLEDALATITDQASAPKPEPSRDPRDNVRDPGLAQVGVIGRPLAGEWGNMPR